MTLILKTLGSALLTAGLLASVQAAAVPLHAVIDFEDLATLTGPSANISVGDSITNQYSQFGLEFTEPNVVNCSRQTPAPGNVGCTAPIQIGVAPHSGRNFLMNKQGLGPFSVRVLDGFSLSTMKLDIARNSSTFYIKFFDANNGLLGSPVDEQTGSDFRWAMDVDLGAITSAVRRIEFGGSPTTAFAIDFMSFDYVNNLTNVPEPAALGLVALALAGLGLARRRKA